MDKRLGREVEKLQQQHIQATGEQLVATPSELKKLKQKGVPSNISTTLREKTPEFSPNNIFSLLTTLAVLPVTSCEAERCISCLRRLKTYLRSSIGQDRLTGLALLHIHDIPIDIDQVIEEFALLYPRRMKLTNILND